jgi:molybdenum cofactor biosynthesis enzyme MoaA
MKYIKQFQQENEIKNNNMFMDIKEMETILKKLIVNYNIKKVDIGALEPFTHPKIIDLLNTIEKLNLEYAITTNGSLLSKYIANLKKLKHLKKVRISFYTLNENLFNKISNSSHFNDVYKSILMLKENNIPLELNCLVLKGYEKDMLNIIDFAIQNNIKLKVYNLYYMPQYKEMFDKYFISSDDILNIIKNKYNNTTNSIKEFKDKRNRIILKIENLELVIKEDKNINRDNKYCKSCEYILDCKEGFAEYLRVDPDFGFYPCYLRKDLKFSLKDDMVLENLNAFNEKINIRLIISGLCNFKCSFPDGKMWCLKQGGNYKWKN